MRRKRGWKKKYNMEWKGWPWKKRNMRETNCVRQQFEKAEEHKRIRVLEIHVGRETGTGARTETNTEKRMRRKRREVDGPRQREDEKKGKWKTNRLKDKEQDLYRLPWRRRVFVLR